MSKSKGFNLILVLLQFIYFSSIEAKNLNSKPLFSDTEISKIKKILSKKNLLKLKFESKSGVDQANQLYDQIVLKITSEIEAYINKNKLDSKKSFVLSEQNDQNLLIYIVDITQFFSEEIYGGLIHFSSFSKLMRTVPKDGLRAIQNSKLSKNNQILMIDTLKSMNTDL